MQTPEKIAAALRAHCDDYNSCINCPAEYWCHTHKGKALEIDAANMIESLSTELEQVKRERDAAVHDLVHLCAICVHDRGFNEFDDAVCAQCWDKSKWQWRGVVTPMLGGEVQ